MGANESARRASSNDINLDHELSTDPTTEFHKF